MMIQVEHARTLAEKVLIDLGTPKTHARIQVDLLLEAEMRGIPSHGLLRLRRIVERIRNGVTDPRATGKLHWAARGFLSVDGERGLGPVIVSNTLEALTARARADGVAIAGIRNNNHIGMLAWYAEQVASKDQILIGMTSSEALVHAWGGRKRLLGTNPLAIGVPAFPEPLVLDMATSLVSMGKIHDFANRGEAIPAGWALDDQGNPTTDAATAKNGAIAPFGGAKGYALGIALEVLVTSLSACAIGTDVRGTLDSEEICNKGDVFIVISQYQDSMIKRLVSDYLAEVRCSTPDEFTNAVTVPGDRARARRSQAVREGLDIDDQVWGELLALDSTILTGNATVP